MSKARLFLSAFERVGYMWCIGEPNSNLNGNINIHIISSIYHKIVNLATF